jgi:pSer/pThr/pTyr-binding forkhead associated (FHA) protein
MAQLTMRRGPEPGKIYPLSEESIQIGRGARNDIVIIDNEVSREHCRLIRREYGYELFDLDSSNGTFVNGQRVKDSWALPVECIVELGDSITLEYVVEPEDIADTGVRQFVIDRELKQGDSKPAFLVVVANSQPLPAVYPIEGEIIDIGRGTTNNVIIIEPEISRNHLRLTLQQHGYLIQDLESMNGTSLNGVLLKDAQLLHDGDVIRIGTTITIRYTTNPELFLSKKTTSHLGTREETKERTKNRRTLPAVTSVLRETPRTPSSVGTGLEPGTLVDHVLLAYSRNEWETIVAPLVDRLYSAEIPVWVEQYLAPGGDDWLLALEQAKVECWLLVVVVSKDAITTDYIQKIWRHFQNREKPVILLVTEEVERLPIGANRAYQIKYYKALPEDSLTQVVEAIQQLR